MIGVIAVLTIAVWFYRTADRLGLPHIAWIAGGVIVYYAGFAAWMYLLLRPLLGAAFREHGLWLGLSMDISAALFGILCAAMFRSRIMLKQGQ